MQSDCKIFWLSISVEIDILDFLYEDSYYRKSAADTITVGWVWPGESSETQTCIDLLGCLWLVWGMVKK